MKPDRYVLPVPIARMAHPHLCFAVPVQQAHVLDRHWCPHANDVFLDHTVLTKALNLVPHVRRDIIVRRELLIILIFLVQLAPLVLHLG